MNKKVKIHILILFSLIVFMKNIFAEQVTEVSDQEFFDEMQKRLFNFFSINTTEG